MATNPLILVVEDDPPTLQLVCTQLETEGHYTVVPARNLGEARFAVERFEPDLIIIDRFLGDGDGLALCRWVKREPDHNDTMIIVLSGAGSTEHKLTGFEAGADDYITKPYHPAEFLSRVQVMLRIKMMQDEVRKDRAEMERLNAALTSHLAAVESLLVNIIGARVPDAHSRSQKASRFARWVGDRLEMEAESQHELELAARLHEIGKVILSDDILAQEQAHRTSDSRMATSHSPLFGQMIVGNIPELRNVSLLLRHQMENYDGTGFPGRLAGEEISLSCRVLRVVNYLEEITRPGLAQEGVLSLLRSASGTILDPSLVRLAEEYVTTVEDPTWLDGKRQVRVEEIKEGMVIAADLFTASGIKLLPSGSRLSRSHIHRIFSHHANDPIINAVYVFV